MPTTTDLDNSLVHGASCLDRNGGLPGWLGAWQQHGAPGSSHAAGTATHLQGLHGENVFSANHTGRVLVERIKRAAPLVVVLQVSNGNNSREYRPRLYIDSGNSITLVASLR